MGVEDLFPSVAASRHGSHADAVARTPPMVPPVDPPRRARLEQALSGLDMARLYGQVLAYACKKADTREMAEDLTQKYFVEAIDPETSLWDPDKLPIHVYVMGRVRGALAATRRADHLHNEDHILEEVKQHFPRSVAGPDHALAVRARHEAIAALVRDIRARCEAEPGGALASLVLDLYEKGVMKAAEQAATLGVAIDDVYVARRAITRRAKAIREKWTRDAGEDLLARAVVPDFAASTSEDDADADEAEDE
jgi:hypothetical protein